MTGQRPRASAQDSEQRGRAAATSRQTGAGRVAGRPDPSHDAVAGAEHAAVAWAYDRRSQLSLQDILDFAGDAGELVSRGRDRYDADRMLRLAAEAIASRIGEAVARLSPELVRDHPEIPFRPAKAMRNFVSHEYDRVDPQVVWVTLESQVPALAEQVRRLLDGGGRVRKG